VIESGTPTSASSCRPTHTSSGNDDREAAEQAALVPHRGRLGPR
jgi:hypothetical protein